MLLVETIYFFFLQLVSLGPTVGANFFLLGRWDLENC